MLGAPHPRVSSCVEPPPSARCLPRTCLQTQGTPWSCQRGCPGYGQQPGRSTAQHTAHSAKQATWMPGDNVLAAGQHQQAINGAGPVAANPSQDCCCHKPSTCTLLLAAASSCTQTCAEIFSIGTVRHQVHTARPKGGAQCLTAAQPCCCNLHLPHLQHWSDAGTCTTAQRGMAVSVPSLLTWGQHSCCSM
jgi:hypothetical protein